MVIRSQVKRLTGGGINKRRLKLLAASLALSTFLPAIPTFAAEEPVPAEEVAEPKETAVEAETNVDYLNYLEMEDYFFAAERIPTNKWDTPANVHIITSQEIEDNHYQSVGEALSHVNGVIVDNLGMVLTPTIEMNGSDRVLLLLDGRRMISNQVSERQSVKSNLESIPSIKMVERIEIVKGGNSALYGSDAVGGVINIVTKKGTRNETTVDINTGSWKTHNYEITNQGVAGKFSWFVTGGLHRRGYVRGSDLSHSKEKDYTLEDRDHKNNTATIRLDNRFDDRSSLTLTAAHISNNYQNSYTLSWDNKRKHSRIYNDISLSYNFKEGTSTPGWLRYFNDYTSGSRILLGGGRVSVGDSARMQGIEYQNGWEIGRHKIIAGFEWHRHNIHTNERAIVFDGKATNTAVYLQDTISLSDKWTVIPGLRYDHDKGSGSNWSPKIAVNYRADEKTKIYGSWGRVYNPPSVIQLYTSLDPEYARLLGYDHRGNPNLHAEKGHAETFGIEHNFDENTSIAVNYFHNDVNDIIYWANEYNGDVQATPVNPYNAVNEKRHGIELSFNKKISDKWRVDLGYTHVSASRDVRYSDEANISSFRYLNNLNELDDYRYRVPNSYRIGVHYTCGPWKANLLANIGEGYRAKYSSLPSSKCVVLDLNASYDVKDNFTVYVRGRNITNQNFAYLDKHGYLDEYGGAGYTAFGKSFQIGAIYRF